MSYAGQPTTAPGGRGICGRWNGVCCCTSRVLEYTCYYSTISPTTYALPSAQGPLTLTQSEPGPASLEEASSCSQEMLYPSSSAAIPDTHDYNAVSNSIFPFYPTSLYQSSSSVVLTPTILPPIPTSTATKAKITNMRSCATVTGPRCTRFKHSSSLREQREHDIDLSGSTTNPGGWFLQKLIEVATTGNLAPTEQSFSAPTDADIEKVSEELRKVQMNNSTAEEKVPSKPAELEGEGAVLAISRTLESLTVSNKPASTKSSLSSLPSNPTPSTTISSSRITIPPHVPVISTSITPVPAPSPPSTPPPLSPSLTATPSSSPPQLKPYGSSLVRSAQICSTYFPSSPILSAKRYTPSTSAHTYPVYKTMPSSVRDAGGLTASGSGSGVSRAIRRDRDRGKDKERDVSGGDRVYNGAYTWSGYSSDGSYDHASSSSSSSSPTISTAILSSSAPSPSSSSFASSSKVQAGRIGKRRTGSSGASSSSSSSASGVLVVLGMGMGMRRVARRGPGSPAVLGKQKMIGKDDFVHGMGVPVRRDSGVDVGMDVGMGMGEMEVDESGDVCMIMDEDYDYEF